MGLISAVKAVIALGKAENFLKEHESTVNKVKKLVDGVRKTITFLEDNRDDFQRHIDNAKEVLDKLNKVVNK